MPAWKTSQERFGQEAERLICESMGMFMKHPTPDYLLLAVSEGSRSLIGAGVAMLFTCMLGGAIPLAGCSPA